MDNFSARAKWPVYQRNEEASCFNCGADLDGSYPLESTYPPGQGAWLQECPKCGYFTFYDLAEVGRPSRPTPTEQSPSYRKAMMEAGRGRQLP